MPFRPALKKENKRLFEKAKDMRDVSTLRAKVYYLGVDLMQKEEASRTTSAASTASVGVHFAE